MEEINLLAPQYFYSIRVGIINFVEMENGKDQDAISQYETTKLLEDKTIGIILERKQEKSLYKLLEEKCPEQLKRYESYLQLNWREQLCGLLSFHDYWSIQLEGYVFQKFPIAIILKPEEDEFGFYFALRLWQLPLLKIDAFLDYQFGESFGYNKTSSYRFLQLCLREYKTGILSEDIVRTVEEWMELKRMESSPLERKEKIHELGVKISCKADTETIYKYFDQLTRRGIFSKEDTEHILYYAFAAFSKEVPAKKFTPANVKKGELMKFIQHFYTMYSYARLEAGNWIKLLLIDSTTSFEGNGKTEEEIIQYIKDNWSKEPVQYNFRRP